MTAVKHRARVRSIPVEIAFREMQPSAATEQALHRNLRWLARSFPELTACRVLIEPNGAGSGPYHVRIDLTVPPGRLGAEARPTRAATRHELTSLIRDAFDRARRELAFRRRGAVRPPNDLF